MKYTKKIFAVALSMILCLGMASTVFGANVDTWGGFPTQRYQGSSNETKYTRAVQRCVASYSANVFIDIMESGGFDGSFGSATKSAVEKFQRIYNTNTGAGLSVDGSCGPKTWRALYNSLISNNMSSDNEFYVWRGVYHGEGHINIIRKGTSSGNWGARPANVDSDKNSVSWYVFHTGN